MHIRVVKRAEPPLKGRMGHLAIFTVIKRFQNQITNKVSKFSKSITFAKKIHKFLNFIEFDPMQGSNPRPMDCEHIFQLTEQRGQNLYK